MQTCRVCNGSGREMRFVIRGPFQSQVLYSFVDVLFVSLLVAARTDLHRDIQVAVPCSGCKGEGELNTAPCSECHGQKVSQGVSDLKITVDPGKADGDKIVLAGEADQTPGVMPGDIIFIIKELPHERFKRVGTDLFMKKRLTLREALCGCAFSFKHLDGRTVLVKTAPGEVLSPGLCKHIDGEGFPQAGMIYRKGRLFIDFEIEFPAQVYQAFGFSCLPFLFFFYTNRNRCV